MTIFNIHNTAQKQNITRKQENWNWSRTWMWTESLKSSSLIVGRTIRSWWCGMWCRQMSVCNVALVIRPGVVGDRRQRSCCYSGWCWVNVWDTAVMRLLCKTISHRRAVCRSSWRRWDCSLANVINMMRRWPLSAFTTRLSSTTQQVQSLQVPQRCKETNKTINVIAQSSRKIARVKKIVRMVLRCTNNCLYIAF